jgi:hypothetical protein
VSTRRDVALVMAEHGLGEAPCQRQSASFGTLVSFVLFLWRRLGNI